MICNRAALGHMLRYTTSIVVVLGRHNTTNHVDVVKLFIIYCPIISCGKTQSMETAARWWPLPWRCLVEVRIVLEVLHRLLWLHYTSLFGIDDVVGNLAPKPVEKLLRKGGVKRLNDTRSAALDFLIDHFVVGRKRQIRAHLTYINMHARKDMVVVIVARSPATCFNIQLAYITVCAITNVSRAMPARVTLTAGDRKNKEIESINNI